ncbi:MAG: biopolymer transporter ExbD, partial [Pseudomonadota bacterium]
PLQGQDEPLTVTIQKNRKVYIQKTLVSIEELGVKLKAIAGEKMDTRIFVRGDKDVDYGSIMRAVGEVNAAGFSKVALITEQPQTQSGNQSHKER